jgi:hypothetical protein
MGRSRQEMFDRSVRKVIAQGGRSENHLGRCAYSSPGRRCAIGWLLSLEEIGEVCKRGFNTGASVQHLIRQELVGLNLEEADFLSDLQAAHDNARKENFSSSFIEKAARVADRYKLSKEELYRGAK